MIWCCRTRYSGHTSRRRGCSTSVVQAAESGPTRAASWRRTRRLVLATESATGASPLIAAPLAGCQWSRQLACKALRPLERWHVSLALVALRGLLDLRQRLLATTGERENLGEVDEGVRVVVEEVRLRGDLGRLARERLRLPEGSLPRRELRP